MVIRKINAQISYKGRCDLTRRTRVKALRHPAFKVAHLAAGVTQVKDASGGPAGGQTFARFKRVGLINKSLEFTLSELYLKCGCDLNRDTRGKAHPKPAFEVF